MRPGCLKKAKIFIVAEAPIQKKTIFAPGMCVFVCELFCESAPEVPNVSYFNGEAGGRGGDPTTAKKC